MLGDVLDLEKLDNKAALAWEKCDEAARLFEDSGSKAEVARQCGITYEAVRKRLRANCLVNHRHGGGCIVIMRHLIDVGSVTYRDIIDQLWGHDPEGGPLYAQRIISIYVWKLRKCLRPGWGIRTNDGQGFALTYGDVPMG